MAAGKIFAISFAINAALGGGFSAAMSGGTAAMRRLKNETTQIKNEQRQLDAAWRASQASVSAYRARVSSLTAQYQAGRISESQFRTGVRIASQAMQSASMSASEYRTNLQRLQGELQRTQSAMQGMAAAKARAASASLNFSTAKTGLMDTVATAGMFSAALLGPIETAAKFESAMSKVQAITRANGTEMQMLTDNARMLGETTQFSATQAADAMSYLGMAGWNANQIIAGMPGLLALAAAGGTDLARTADIVSDDLTAFGLSADQAGHMADVFAVTATRTNTNVEMLGETMKYAAPVAKAFGASMEETAALAGLMANSGIKASQAGTALRSGFLRLAGPPKKASQAMQELGMSMSDITAQQNEAKAALESLGISMSDMNGPRKMSAILTELRDKTAGLGQEEKLATLKMIFGTEAATGWLAVLDAGPDVFDDLVNQMENSDGEAQKMADTMMNNTKGAMIQLKSATEGLAISVGNVFLPSIKSALQAVAGMAAAASKWVKAHEGVVASIGAVGVSIAGLITGIQAIRFVGAAFSYISAQAGELFYAIRNNALAQRLFQVALSGSHRAMTALRAIMSSGMFSAFTQRAIAAFNTLRALSWAQVGTAMRTGLTSGLSSMAAALSQFGARCTAAMSAARASVVANATAIARGAGNAARAVLAMARGFSIAGALQTAGAAFRALGTAILSVGRASMAAMFSPLGIALIAIAGAAYLIYSNWSMVGPFFMGLWNQITAAFSNAWMMIQPALSNLQMVFGQLLAVIGPQMQALGMTIMSAFASISAAVTENSGAFSALISVIGYLAEILGGVLIGAFIVSANVMTGVVTAAINVIAAVFTGLIGVISGVVEMISGILAGDWSAAWDGAVNAVSAAFNAMLGIASGIGSAIVGTIENIISSVRSAVSAIIGLRSSSGGGDDGGDVEVDSNAKGGIYKKGAFLTTFAEESDEAAIPLDGSARAIGLWRMAGEILGVGGDSKEKPEYQKGPSYTRVKTDVKASAPKSMPEAPEQPQPQAQAQTVKQEPAKPQVNVIREPGEPVQPQVIQQAPEAPEQPQPQAQAQTVKQEPAKPQGGWFNAPPISITLNFYGDEEPKRVKEAVIEAGRKVQKTFAEQMEAYRHERRRLAFE